MTLTKTIVAEIFIFPYIKIMIIIVTTHISKLHPLIVLFLKEYSIIVNEFLKISKKGTF